MTTSREQPLILKFGGTSVADAARMRRVAELVAPRAAEGPVVVVVSAMGGVTGALEEALILAAGGDRGWQGVLDSLRSRHAEAVASLGGEGAGGGGGAPATPAGDPGLLPEELLEEELPDLLHGVFLLREASPRTRDAVLSAGERLSAPLVARALATRHPPGARAVDARTLLVAEGAFGNARVLAEPSAPRVRGTLGPLLEAGVVPVVTGFIASTLRGQTCTLGRGGSDYTAAELGRLLGAGCVEIWTDVDGVMTADPRVVKRAYSLPSLTYAELMELSHFGAKVVYPPTVVPAREAGIPLRIRNTLNPSAPGTWVHRGARPSPAQNPGGGPEPSGPIRGIASLPRCALLRLEGDGMAGVPGIAERLFGAMARRGVSVILISQASSERSICLAVAPGDAEEAREAVAQAFALEVAAGLVNPLVVEEEAAIVSVVGEGIRNTPNVSGRLFSVLGARGINVRAIAQGSSELNISVVVRAEDEARALRAIHDAFFLPGLRRARLYVAGTGRVGQALLGRLAEAFPRLREERGIHLAMDGVARTGALRVEEGMPPDRWMALVEPVPGGDPSEDPLEALVSAALAQPRRPVLFVDVTASDAVARHYPRLLRAGVSVITANRRGVAVEGGRWEELQEAAARGLAPRGGRGSGGGLYVEATVWAGLPLLRTLADLVDTGDRVLALEGALSGTWSHLLAGDDGPFSDRARHAWALGTMKGEPWEDLSGVDTARKLVILARAAGLSLEVGEVEVEPFLPGPAEGWQGLGPEAFLARLADPVHGLDARVAEAEARAREGGRRLRYLALLAAEEGGRVRARVGIEAVDPDHPAWHLPGGDNLVAVTSLHHRAAPLVVRGPGAGPEVAASGVLSDILRAVLEGG